MTGSSEAGLVAGCGSARERPAPTRVRIADLQRGAEQMAAEASRPVAPEGFVELEEAVRMLGVSKGALRQWELRGRLNEGQRAQIPGSLPRTKIYPVEEIERMHEEILKANKEFPPPGWLDMDGLPRARVSVQVWKGGSPKGASRVAVVQPADDGAVQAVQHRGDRSAR